MKKDGELKKVSDTVKPHLNEENKRERVRFALSMIVPGTNNFDPIFDVVHVNEKWFYLTKVKKSLYVVPGEAVPTRSLKSKRFMDKVMFLVAVARPRYDFHRKTLFDGKIGLWPCVRKEPAIRNSKNRKRGTPVTKCFEINNQEYVKLLTKSVIPAIREKWPKGDRHMAIKIQQDNAPPHRKIPEDLIKISAGDLNIKVVYQPPNSPDFNVLDLGFFCSIQALQYRQAPKDVDELILAVQKAYNELPKDTLDDVFLSLQTSLRSALQTKGNDDYKLGHMGKESLRRDGRLPVTLSCDLDVIEQAKQVLL